MKNSFTFLFVLFLTAGTIFLISDKNNDNKLFQHYTPEEYRLAGLEGPGAIPNDWMARQRSYPHGIIKQESYLKAMKESGKLIAKANELTGEWIQSGPTNIGGRITDIEMSPSNGSVVYVAAASGGIYKSVDEGASWSNVFTDVPVISVGDIAIDPNDENVLYAGTGEANASSFSFLGMGLYKSTDAGNSWSHIGLEESGYIGRIVVDHSNSQNVLVAACGTLFSPNETRGVYKSTDGGTTWQRKLFLTDSTAAVDLIQHPQDANTWYATMWERMRGLNYRRSFGPTSGVYKSTDGGENWIELTNGLPTGENVGRIGIAIAESNPDVLYTFYDLTNSEVAVYKTTNGGNNWNQTSDWALSGMNSNFGWYFGQVRVSPQNENIVYVMGVYNYRTTNGGTSWQSNGDEMHVDHHAMYFDKITGKIYEGNDGGLYTSSNGGSSWNKINTLPLTQYYAISMDYQNPERIYGGTQDNSTIRTLTGNLDDFEVILGGDGFYTLVDYTDPNTIYAEYQWGELHRSTNGGIWFDYIADDMGSDRRNWSSPLAMHPENPSILYFGTYRVWKTTNKGNSWTAVSGDLTKGDDGSTFHTISTIDISNVNPQIVIAGSDDGKVHISPDGGGDWFDITAGLPDRWITRVMTDEFDENTIYVTCSGFRWDERTPHVLKSTNLGTDWTDITSNLPDMPVNCIAQDPQFQGRLFVGTDTGIFYSLDDGAFWLNMNNGMPNVPMTGLEVHQPSRTLLAGTYGVSSFKFDLNQIIPVELTSFNVSVSGGDVLLEWQTATETNNYGFEIERKAAGERFSKLGFVGGKGTSSERAEYSFRDQTSLPGIRYDYRLKQVDFDGNFSYSETKSIEAVPTDFTLEQNYPNPFNPETKIRFSIPDAGNVSLLVYNINGEKVATLANGSFEGGSHEFTFNGKNLASGIYISSLSFNGKTKTKKMMLLK